MAQESDEFEWQLKQEQEEQWKRDNGYIYTDPNDGTMYEWDPEKKAWFPKVDENFLAYYQANYGVESQESSADGKTEEQTSEIAPSTATEEISSSKNGDGSHDPKVQEGSSSQEGSKDQPPQPAPVYRYQKMQMKRKAEQKSWFEIDPSKNTNVYVSGLPPDITLEEFQTIMSKYGIIMLEEETEKPKLKLYLDDHGNPKGDGRCCYLKRESVDLAIQLLDESELRGHKVHIEVATFTLKGDYKPDMKKKKKPSKKKKKGNLQDKLLDWRPEKKFQQRKRNEQVIILRHVFHPDEFEEDATLINDIKDDLKSECSRYGEVKKVLIFDRHPEGVASVKFKDVDSADGCIKALNGRWFAKRQLEVFAWDGKTDYKIEETDREREERLKKWEDFLEDDEEEKEEGKTEEGKMEVGKSTTKEEEEEEEEEDDDDDEDDQDEKKEEEKKKEGDEKDDKS